MDAGLVRVSASGGQKVGQEQLFELLIEHSPADVKLLVACWLNDEPMMASLLKAHPGLAGGLSEADRRHSAHAARNNDLVALRLMLAAGLPVDSRGQHDT